MRSFDLNRWKCEFGGADELLSKGKGVVWEMTKREINVWKRGAQRLGKDVFLAIGSQLCMWVIAKDWSDSFSVAAKRNDMEVAIAIDSARMEMI